MKTIHRPFIRLIRVTVLFFALFTASLFSCKKVINVSLSNAGPQIVIEGEVTNLPGPYQVSITGTINVGDDNVFPTISGAQVSISDNRGMKDTLTETSPGVYSTHTTWQGQPGVTYTLNVLDSGKTYTAVSTMPQPVRLDSVGFYTVVMGRRGSKDIIEAVPYFQDPPGIRNYYQFTEAINGTPLNQIFIFSDRLSDGRYIAQPLPDDSSHMQIGDALTFGMYCIDSATFEYFRQLQQFLLANPFNSVTPSNPNTDMGGGALGYFSAHTEQTVQTIVK